MSVRGDDAGSAIVEFCVLSVLMLVPLVYLVAVLGRVQAASMAAQAAAREAGRAFVTAESEAGGRERADLAAGIAFADQGFTAPGTVRVDVACRADPCLSPDARVDVGTRVLVLLPGVPHVLDRAIPARLEVTARQVVAVDRFRQTSEAPQGGG